MSAWGDSWGDAWGDSWGAVSPPAPPVETNTGMNSSSGTRGGYLTPPDYRTWYEVDPAVKRRRKEKERMTI